MTLVEKKPKSPFTDSLALLAATGLGTGYSPIAPGTVGSIVGVGLFLASQIAERSYGVSYVSLGVCWGLLFLGLWASSRAVEQLSSKDPRQIVIDEVAGQFIALLLTPGLAESLQAGSWKKAFYLSLMCFGFFRVFDILKPYPIKRVERLKSGLGVMADDVIAGLYAGMCLQLSSFIGYLILLYR